jgi:fructokinase
MRNRILAIGEVLWDLLPTGRQLGGAPANFAYHCRGLGADARIVTRIGADALGEEVLERFRQLELPTDTVTVDRTAPTGTVSVELGPAGQPRFNIAENVAWDLTADATANNAAAGADAVCFGSLAQRSEQGRRAIRSLIAASPSHALLVLDVNLRPPFVDHEVIENSLALADLLKLNDDELPILAGMFGVSGGIRDPIEELARRFHLSCVALTRGRRGSILFSDGTWSDHPGLVVDVCDTVGAGDAFTAALTVGLLAGWQLDEINQRANEVAAFVCTRPGGTPALPDRLTIMPRDP